MRFRYMVLLAMGIAGCVPFSAARSAGVHEDVLGEAGFLFAPYRWAVEARTAIVSGPADGAVHQAVVTFPARGRFLFQIDQAFLSVTRGNTIVSGLGDMRLRVRTKMYAGNGRRLDFVGAFRTGNGNSRLFPFAAQSLDYEAGLGFVDTLEVIHVWAAAQGVSVNRAPETTDDDTRHEDFLRVTGGLLVETTHLAGISVGATLLSYRSGAVREIYFARAHYDATPQIRLTAAAGVEAGNEAQRVGDHSFHAGIQVLF